MRRPILMILLALISSNAMAQWIQVDHNSEFTTYANHSSIRKHGHFAKMMSMYDYKTVQTNMTDSFLYRSTQQQGEYDCKKEASRMLASSLHSKKMGKGRVVHYKSRPLEWMTVSPKGIDETLWKIACSKTQTHQLQQMSDQRQR
jgi:hypothetical protein